jgi:hypothetical protein
MNSAAAVLSETQASTSPEACFFEARERFDALISWAQETSATMSEVEVGAEKRGQQLIRAVIQGHLDLRAQQEPKLESVAGCDGISRTEHREGEKRTVATLVGEVQANRIRYEGGKGVPSLCPQDGSLNFAPGKYSHQVRKRLAFASTQGSFENAIETLGETSAITAPKRQVEKLVRQAACDFDAFYSQHHLATRQPLTASTLMVMTTDAKGILVYPEDLREETRRKLEKEGNSGLYFRKRMAQVASVYQVEPYHRSVESIVRGLMGPSLRVVEPKPKRPKPQDKRVWASIVDSCEDVVDQMFEEALRRDPEEIATWISLVDGAGHQIEVLEDMARAHKSRLVIICDIIHALGYLWDAAKVIEANAPDRQRTWVTQRLRSLLEGEVSQVAAGIRRAKTMLRKRKLTKEQRKTLDESADYLLNHKRYMRYDRYLAAGFPIASGVIEGTVRHLVNDRMAITGAHWRLPSAEAVLRLRALRCSGDFEVYWQFHEQQDLRRNHLSKYPGGQLSAGLTTSPPSQHQNSPIFQILFKKQSG